MDAMYDSLEHTMANSVYEGYSEHSDLGARKRSRRVH